MDFVPSLTQEEVVSEPCSMATFVSLSFESKKNWNILSIAAPAMFKTLGSVLSSLRFCLTSIQKDLRKPSQETSVPFLATYIWDNSKAGL
jgi:hypothetical protein